MRVMKSHLDLLERLMTDRHWLDRMNARLADDEPEKYLSGTPHDSIFIVGAPRSGTTIISQFVSEIYDTAYVDNLMASFWQAPVYGALLSKKLLGQRELSSKSQFGATHSIVDPHEFGGFWREQLAYTDMVQKPNCSPQVMEGLATHLDNISRVFGAQVVYKVFQLSWHIKEYQQIRPGSQWLWMTRNVRTNALSLLRLREKLNGDRALWASSKPLTAIDMDFADYYHEVVYQVMAINAWIERQLAHIGKQLWIKVSYDDFVANPQDWAIHLQPHCGKYHPERLRKFAKGISPRTVSEHNSNDIEGIERAIEFYEKNPIWRGVSI